MHLLNSSRAHRRAWQGRVWAVHRATWGWVDSRSLHMEVSTQQTEQTEAECWAAHMVRTHQRPVRRLYAPLCEPQGQALFTDQQWTPVRQSQHGVHTLRKQDCSRL